MLPIGRRDNGGGSGLVRGVEDNKEPKVGKLPLELLPSGGGHFLVLIVASQPGSSWRSDSPTCVAAQRSYIFNENLGLAY
jgi:hypothetical protein